MSDLLSLKNKIAAEMQPVCETLLYLKVKVNEKDAYIRDVSFDMYLVDSTTVEPRVITTLVINDSEIKTYVINLAYTKGIITGNEFAQNLIEHVVAKCLEYKNKYESVLTEIHNNKLKEQEERQTQEMIKKLQSIQMVDVDEVVANDLSNQYEVLGWMAKHATNISAKLPSNLEDWFVSRFGDVPRHVIDSKKRTTGGYAMQWSVSMTANFDSDVPVVLSSLVKSDTKKICNIGFVWNLIKKYGFQFGKKQDVDEIKDCVPTDCIADFERGYNVK